MQNQDFSGKFIFFDLSGSEIFDISEFHGCKIWSIFKSVGCKFQRNLKSHGCKIQKFFESHGGKFQRFFDFHGGKILGLKKSYGKKKFRPPKVAENFWLFFLVQNQDFSGIFFFDLSGSEIFDISEFHGCKIWSIFKSGGCKFQRNLKSYGCFRDFFWGLMLRRAEKKLTPKPDWTFA